MSDLATPQIRDLAASLTALLRGLEVVPMLVDQVRSVGRQTQGNSLLAQNISEIALAACEAELRSMKAIHLLIIVLRALVPVAPDSNVPVESLEDATRELIIAQERIEKAMEQVRVRSEAPEAPL